MGGMERDEFNVRLRWVVEGMKRLMTQRSSSVGLMIPLILALWGVERWIFSLSSWVPIVLAVWATLQYGNHQRHLLGEELDRKWKRFMQNSSPVTPLEQCQWLNRLSSEVWPSFMNPKLSTKFFSIVEKRLKNKKSRLIESIQLLEFSLGSNPPSLGLQGAYWSTSGDQKIMHLGFDWDTNEMSVLLFAKLGMPVKKTVGVIINSLHIKGDLLLMPILDGKAVLYSFTSTPEVKIGVAFGNGSQSLPATVLPGVSSWLVKILTETLVKTMVEPRRRCFSLPVIDLRKKVSGGIIYVTVVSATKLLRSGSKRSSSKRRSLSTSSLEYVDNEETGMFVEVELLEQKLTRRTDMRSGPSPIWDSMFNMLLHEDTGTLRFNLYQCTQSGVNSQYLSSCEVKIKYGADDSIMFWAIGNESSILAQHANCGSEVEMNVPFEGVGAGELKVRLVLKEWQFGDSSSSPTRGSSIHASSSQRSFTSSSSIPNKTGRKIKITIVEGKDIIMRDKSGKSVAYAKLHYGKVHKRTSTVENNSNPIWDQTVEFDEIAGDDYLKIKCFSVDTLNDDNIGNAHVSFDGLAVGEMRDVWVPLENVKSGELRIQIEVISSSGNGWIELVIIEARDLVHTHLSTRSDPYVRVQYGNDKKSTMVLSKTSNPKWNQIFEFSDDGSPLQLRVKSHNAVLLPSNIGECVVEYQSLPPNEMADIWIPLQKVKKGEIRVQVTRKLPLLHKKTSIDTDSSLTKARQVSSQMKQMINELKSMITEGNSPVLTTQLSELGSLQDLQEEYMAQLETEQLHLLNKIENLGQEFFTESSPSPPRPHSSPFGMASVHEESMDDELLPETPQLLLENRNSSQASEMLSSSIKNKNSLSSKFHRITHKAYSLYSFASSHWERFPFCSSTLFFVIASRVVDLVLPLMLFFISCEQSCGFSLLTPHCSLVSSCSINHTKMNREPPVDKKDCHHHFSEMKMRGRSSLQSNGRAKHAELGIENLNTKRGGSSV